MTKHFIVRGQVQGVAYRYYTKQYADKLGILGTVRNMTDGCVEVYGQGTIEGLVSFEACLKQGSPYSEVTSIEINEIDFINFKDFRIII